MAMVQRCDLRVCVVNGVLNVVIAWRGSAWSDGFRVVSPERVAG